MKYISKKYTEYLKNFYTTANKNFKKYYSGYAHGIQNIVLLK